MTKEEKIFPIGENEARAFTRILERYKAGKRQTERRIISSENWWKLRNTSEERKNVKIGADGGFVSASGWLHNVIVCKHADALDAYPEPNILPREEYDVGEAKTLSSIIPCILEQNHFEETFSDVMWQKLKTGTGVYKIVWDESKHDGRGDIAIVKTNLLNIYWEPGITDIQESRYVFHTELWDTDVLEEQYPVLRMDRNKNDFMSVEFLYDDYINTDGKTTVIEVYYHQYRNGKKLLQYCKYVGSTVLYATENDPYLCERGLYDHGLYPYVFDVLFPIEGSPCGYGYIDLCRNPQTEIDLLKTSFIKNIMVGATPRYFSRGDSSVNENEFLDLSKPIVHVKNADADALRRIEYNPLHANYLEMLDRTIQELRETSGNTHTSTGNLNSGVTAASAIIALQEASGKGIRDSLHTAYRAYTRLVEFCIELIRQFYDMPRQFRILGKNGEGNYIRYTNEALRPDYSAEYYGLRLPVFDIKVSAKKKSEYTRASRNELALQLFRYGFFDTDHAEQALLCLEIMDFDGKDEILRMIKEKRE